jgi:hypothetical protein
MTAATPPATGAAANAGRWVVAQTWELREPVAGAKLLNTGETDETGETKPETEEHVRDLQTLVRQTATDS